MTIAVAIYARVSDPRQAEKDLPIEGQLSVLTEHAERQNWTVVQTYVDPGLTGRIAERPAFQRMIADARQEPRPFDAVLIWKLSRFSRSLHDAVVFEAELKRYGVSLVSFCERGIDNTPAGQLQGNVIKAVNEYYSAALAEDVRRGMERNWQRGGWNNGSPPYGYRVRRDERGCPRLVIVSEEALIVRRIFESAIRLTGREIATELNSEGVPSRSGGKWLGETVNKILRSRTYRGELHSVYGVKKKAHEAIIIEEQWQTARRAIEARMPHTTHPRRVRSSFMYSGLVYCGQCGARVNGVSRKRRYYICSRRKNHKDCDAVAVRKEVAEERIATELKKVLLQPESLRKLVDLHNEYVSQANAGARSQVAMVDRQLATLQRRRKNLITAIEDGLADDALTRRLGELSTEVRDLEAKRHHLAMDASRNVLILDETEIAAYIEYLQELLETADIGSRRAFLQGFIRRIVLDGDRVEVEYHLPDPGGPTEPSGGRPACVGPPLRLAFTL